MKRYITNNKKKFVKTFLTTTSFLVVAVSHDVMAGAARTETDKFNGTLNFDTGSGFNPAVRFVDGSTLQFNSARTTIVNIEDVKILAIDVHGKNISSDDRFNFRITKNATIGSIVDLGDAGDNLAPASAANKMDVAIPVVSKTLTLSGTSSYGIGFAADANQAPENNYSALGKKA